MKKLVTALIIVLPIVLVVALFAITGIVRISADIPVNGIEITNKGDGGIHFFDIANYAHPLYETDLGIQVLPSVANNKEYTLSITDTDGNPTDIVSRDENGAFRLHGIGIAKLTYTTKDGGYSDSVVFSVTATGALDFNPILSDNGGNIYTLEEGENTDYSATVTTGNYILSGKYFPSAVQSADISVSAENDEIIVLNGLYGGFNVRFSGKTVISMTVSGAGGDIVKTIALTVLPAAAVTINGMDAGNDDLRLSSPLNTNTVTFGVQFDTPLSESDITVGGIGATGEVRKVQSAQNAFTVTLTLDEPFTAPTAMRYTLRAGGKQYRFYVDFDSHKISVYSPSNPDGEGDIVILAGSTATITASCFPYGSDIGYRFEAEGESAISVNGNENGKCTVRATGVGETTLRVIWSQYAENGEILATGTETRRIIAVQGYSSLVFGEHSESYGLGGTLAVATDKFDSDGNFAANAYLSKFRAFDRAGNAAALSDIVFTTSDSAITTVEADGNSVYFKARATGKVTVKAIWKYGDVFGVNPAEFTFTAVDGVETRSDSEIRKAFADNRQVVLAEDIYLGENLFVKNSANGREPKYDSATMREKLLQFTAEIKTTAD